VTAMGLTTLLVITLGYIGAGVCYAFMGMIELKEAGILGEWSNQQAFGAFSRMVVGWPYHLTKDFLL
jgi:hypothetical protein